PADLATARPPARVRVVSSPPLLCSALSAMRRPEGLPDLLADLPRPDAGRLDTGPAGAGSGVAADSTSPVVSVGSMSKSASVRVVSLIQAPRRWAASCHNVQVGGELSIRRLRTKASEKRGQRRA